MSSPPNENGQTAVSEQQQEDPSFTHAPENEQEPLLGRPGDVSQPEGSALATNLITGTAPIAQFGGILLFGLTWGAIFSHNLLLFSAHPLLNSAAILLAVQAILILQPTHTPTQKRIGTYVHAGIWAVALGSFYASLIVILVHKKNNGIGHFESPHAYVGVIAYVLLAIQGFVGFTQYFTPGLYGSVDKAKSLYKYHRVAGYVLVALIAVNVVLASLTPYAGKILGLKTWATSLAVILTAVGLVPRIKKQKMKFF